MADRCVPQAERREDRWQTIVHESVEQCERLWAPTLQPAVAVQAWLDGVDGRVAMAVTRDGSTPELSTWLGTDPSASSTWLLVGPEVVGAKRNITGSRPVACTLWLWATTSCAVQPPLFEAPLKWCAGGKATAAHSLDLPMQWDIGDGESERQHCDSRLLLP